MALFPKVKLARPHTPLYQPWHAGPLPVEWSGGEERVCLVAWRSTMALCLPFPGPSVPGGRRRALPQILIQGPAWGRDGHRQNALYTEIFYCWEGVFLPQFVCELSLVS